MKRVMLQKGAQSYRRCCTEVFDCLSLSAVINDRIFCVHGGLSPSSETIDQIRTIDRKQEVPHDAWFEASTLNPPARFLNPPRVS
ncbi:hypothetical protein niasHT_017741 [Heterodera trifolii]|uniref:protein-serine/threonine phosphatase n=1 Tax=Heterodera trifolii TaxID=157864 RepID=A0ABD2LJI9_9BILA